MRLQGEGLRAGGGAANTCSSDTSRLAGQPASVPLRRGQCAHSQESQGGWTGRPESGRVTQPHLFSLEELEAWPLIPPPPCVALDGAPCPTGQSGAIPGDTGEWLVSNVASSDTATRGKGEGGRRWHLMSTNCVPAAVTLRCPQLRASCAGGCQSQGRLAPTEEAPGGQRHRGPGASLALGPSSSPQVMRTRRTQQPGSLGSVPTGDSESSVVPQGVPHFCWPPLIIPTSTQAPPSLKGPLT